MADEKVTDNSTQSSRFSEETDRSLRRAVEAWNSLTPEKQQELRNRLSQIPYPGIDDPMIFDSTD